MAPQLRLATESSNYGSMILALTWTEAAIAIVLLVGRFYTSWRITRRLRADFHIALFTFCVAIVGQICLTVAVHYGLGSHIQTLDAYHSAQALKYGWIFQVIFVACMALGKLAIIAFLLQIRGPHDPKPYLLYFVGVTQTVVMLITMVFITQQCSPNSKLWDDSIPGVCDGKERNQRFGFFQGAWSAVCDMILALYPIWIIWKVRVDLHVKVGLCVLMGLGVIAAVCSAIRTAELQTLMNINDVTYSLSPLIIWAATETWIILIVSCVPPIRPLFVQIFKVVSTATNSTRSRSRSRSISRSQFSKGGEILVTRSDKSEYHLKPIEQTGGSISGFASDEFSYESKADAVGDDGLHRDVESGQARSKKVHVTTKIDVDYSERSQRRVSPE